MRTLKDLEEDSLLEVDMLIDAHIQKYETYRDALPKNAYAGKKVWEYHINALKVLKGNA